MSAVLVLNRFGLSSMHYPEWLGSGVETHMITQSDAVSVDDDLSAYASVTVMGDYFLNPLVELVALDLHREHEFVEIIAMSEFDLLRAARLRERLGIAGQSSASALAYRDKFTMKTLLRNSGVPVADFAAVDTVLDLVQFIQDQGYPVVVKPRRGAASMGVTVVRTPEQLAELAPQLEALRGDASADLLAEAFIEHQLVHVDGVIFNGHVVASWPSYSTPGLSFLERQASRSTMFERNDAQFDPTVELVADALNALPTPRVTIFHAEVFLAASGERYINEIASRMGGGRIKTMWQAAFGINLEEWYVRNVLRQSNPVMSEFPQPLIGACSDYPHPRNGVLVDAPAECEIEGVYKFKLEVPIGTHLGTPTSISDVIGSSTAARGSAEEVTAVLDQVDTWFLESVVIESVPASGQPT